MTWNVSDALSLAPGIRVNHDKKDGSYSAVVIGGLPNPTPAQQALKNSVLQNQQYSANFSDWNVSGDVTLSWSHRWRPRLCGLCALVQIGWYQPFGAADVR